MNTVTVNQVQANFKEIVERVLEDVEPTIVTTETGASIVMLSLDEYNAWQETIYLLSTPTNAEHLAKSIAEEKSGYATEQNLIDP